MPDLITCKCAYGPLQFQLPELKQLLQLCFYEVPHGLLVYLAKTIWQQGDAISYHAEEQNKIFVDCCTLCRSPFTTLFRWGPSCVMDGSQLLGCFITNNRLYVGHTDLAMAECCRCFTRKRHSSRRNILLCVHDGAPRIMGSIAIRQLIH